MISKLFLGLSLLGAEWVLYLLVLLSMLSVTLIIERFRFYRQSRLGIEAFRQEIRNAARMGDWNKALAVAKTRSEKMKEGLDFEGGLTAAILDHAQTKSASHSPGVLDEIAQDSILRTKVRWEKNLAILATIGSNAPFIGLFGTVIGIIQAFHQLSGTTAGEAGVQSVTAGLSEALIATAAGILVAIPAVVAFNLYQRRVKSALGEAEALKSFLIGKITGSSETQTGA